MGAALASILAVAGAKGEIAWAPLNGPLGGSVYSLATDSAGGFVYAGIGWRMTAGGTFSGGTVFRSADGGDSWTRVHNGIGAIDPKVSRVRALAVIPSTGRVLAGLDGGGVLRSDDHGDSWTASNGGLTALLVRAMGVDSAGVAFAGTSTGGVFRSLDGGQTWAASNAGLANLDVRAFAFGPSLWLCGTQAAGVFKSVDGGVSWSPMNSGLTATAINALGRDASSGALFCGTSMGLFRAADAASSWNFVSGPFDATLVESVIASDGAVFVSNIDGIHRSVDGVSGWQTVGTWTPRLSMRPMLSLGAGILVAGSLREGLYRSDDGGMSWTKSQAGMNAHTVHHVGFGRNGRMFATTTMNGLYHSDDLGDTWSGPDFANEHVFTIGSTAEGELFIGISGAQGSGPLNHCWRSVDEGESWTPLNNGLQAILVSGLAFGGTGEVFCSTGWTPGGIFKSTSHGDNWTNIGLLGNSFGSPGGPKAMLCVTRRQNGDLWAGGEGTGVWRLLNGGGAWEYTGLNQATGAGQQFHITFAPNGYGYAAHDGGNFGIYRTTTAQPGSWLPYTPITDRVFDVCATPQGALYAASMIGGIYTSSDDGNSWTPANAGFDPIGAHSLGIGPDGHLYAATTGHGVYRTVQPVVQVVAGDIDGDGDVDTADLNLLVGHEIGTITNAFGAVRADLNGDGRVNAADIPGFTSAFLGD